eukprot:4678623-Pyramimonas_sp.AAC.1
MRACVQQRGDRGPLGCQPIGLRWARKGPIWPTASARWRPRCIGRWMLPQAVRGHCCPESMRCVPRRAE